MQNLKRTKFHRSVAGALVASFFVCSSPAAVAAPIADPEYQVKLRLSEQAVDFNGEPSAQFRDSFKVLGEGSAEEAVYLDTADGFYSKNGWSIRLRHKESASNYDLTYKYRQPLFYNSLSKDVVEDGLREARDKGFDSSDTNYDAQVNASYRSSSLDFSNKKTATCVTAQCEIPTVDRAAPIVTDAEPGKMQKTTGRKLESSDLKMSQTVSQKSWRVEIGGIKTDLEVARFGGTTWVEISEEETSRKDAARKRDELIKELDRAGLLVKEDAFKTQVVLAGGWQ
ncbi:hypothetical protein [Corynebacterium appendicis]|uniref:hypothetical protein n=1 Tax=Corynebacterium appendicis TaxID=163202 RepID=UPI0023542881|nr:hypothetical protein [Corynebacterium appendicis]